MGVMGAQALLALLLWSVVHGAGDTPAAGSSPRGAGAHAGAGMRPGTGAPPLSGSGRGAGASPLGAFGVQKGPGLWVANAGLLTQSGVGAAGRVGLLTQ